MKKSKLEERALNIIKLAGFTEPESEYRFHPTRKWRFDLAYPKNKIAIELEGGIWTMGAHSRGAHFNSDSEKYNEAVILGWKVLRYTTNTLNNIPNDLWRLLCEKPTQ